MRQAKSSTYRKRQPGLKINKKQITVIKVALSSLRIDDATYRDMLHDRYGVTSCTKLSYDQAGEFIRELEGKGFTLKPKGSATSRPAQQRKPTLPRPPIPRDHGNVIALVSQDELDKINAVAKLVDWREANGLALFLEKRMGIKDGTVRTSKEACKAIEGLKKMFENQMKANCGSGWWKMTFENPGIMEYIAQHCPEEWR